jgi:hypothetical protein
MDAQSKLGSRVKLSMEISYLGFLKWSIELPGNPVCKGLNKTKKAQALKPKPF